MALWLWVGIGGFIGSVLRYLVAGWAQRLAAFFPLGTLTVNVIGCFLIGVIMYLAEYRGMFNQETRVFWAIGILGGFTTMSSFSYETLRLLEQRQMLHAGLNVAGTIFLCLFAVYLGRIFALGLWK